MGLLEMDPDVMGMDDEEEEDPVRRLQRLTGLRAAAQLSDSPDDDTSAGGGGSAGPYQRETGGERGGTDAGNQTGTTVDTSDAVNPLAMLRRGGSGVLPTVEGRDMGLPAGFDESGMPTEYPATAQKNQAADRLERAQGPFQSHGLKQDLFRGLLTAAPALIGLAGGGGFAGAGAAQGALEAEQTTFQRNREELGRAQGQYQFEAGREEREREQAIKEKVAMANIESQRAYRMLMASIANRRANTGQQNADVNAQNKGLYAEKQPDGTVKIRNVDPGDLSALNQAKLGLQSAQEQLADARTKAVPEMVRVAQDRVKIAEKGVQERLLALQMGMEKFNATFGMQREALSYRETGPTNDNKNMAKMARATQVHIPVLREEINEANNLGYIGPTSGRVYNQFMAGEIGSTGNPEDDEKLGQLMGDMELISSAMLRTHFNGRGALRIYGSFKNMMAAKRSAEELNGVLSSFESYLDTYGKMDKWDRNAASPGDTRPPISAETQDAISRLRGGRGRGQGQGTGGSGGRQMPQPGGPPPGAKYRHYSEIR